MFPFLAGAQTRTVTLQVKDKSVEEIILELRKTSGYRFLFNHEEVKDKGLKSVNMKDAEMAEVMKTVLEGTGLTYRIEKDVIVISPEKPSSASAVRPRAAPEVVENRGSEA